MASKSTEEHREAASEIESVGVSVITVSDTRTTETDKSGQLMQKLLKEAGFNIVQYRITKDEPEQIRELIISFCEDTQCQAVLLNGGTGLSPRDGTFEVVESLIERPMPGFGEIFRMLSWEEVGAASMLSRATAGLRGKVIIFSTPGSSNAVNLAMTKLIIPELRHLVLEINK